MSRITKATGVALGTGAMVLSGAGLAMADAGAKGAAVHSPGVLSGNLVQVPVHVPVNVCGNTVNIVALLNPAFGNACANIDEDKGENSDKNAAKKKNAEKKDTGYGS
ncbi:chaplin [Streptomyces sp. JB150]|uniref:chaplin n=1 Tax=Streptomyces sp. JB150 TaxID=2714844 RepID=UPI001407993A|nr:chaplin [Streptomyces sp. JB150]QIJ62732.1 chaplin [Streptomyces sp. JB150]